MSKPKVVILAGGMGTRLAEETEIRPKPMVEIGGRPILWHIMQRYAQFGFNEFVIALGYKGDSIKRYFRDTCELNGDMVVNMRDGVVKTRKTIIADWTVHLIDTGADTMTGGRVARLRSLLGDDTFLLTYGDGLSDVDLAAQLACHQKHKRIATITAVRPPARFGGLVFDPNDAIRKFTEKPQVGEGWINGGFMAFEPEVFGFIEGDHTILEAHVLEKLARGRALTAYRHEGFWQCMDTIRDRNVLQELWSSGVPPWIVRPASEVSISTRRAAEAEDGR